MILKMARRNLWRNKRRTAITVVSVVFGVWLAVTFTGIAQHTYTQMVDGSARLGFGHLTLVPKGYLVTPSLDKRLSGAASLRGKLLESPEVVTAIVRITGQAMFASATASAGGAFIAIDPGQESRRDNVFIKSLKEGTLFEGTGGKQIVLGQRMAEKLAVQLGKKVVFTTLDANGEIVSDVARVVGIFRTGVDDIDGSMALMPIDTARKVLHYAPDEATMISILLADHRYSERAHADLTRTFTAEGQSLHTWRESQPEIAALVDVDWAANRLFQTMVGILIAAGVLNTMLMSVLERQREFGIMMAVGLSPGSLFRLVLAEALMIGLLGMAIGTLLTTPWYYYLRHVGIDLSAEFGDSLETSGVLIEPVVRIQMFPDLALGILLGVFCLTLLAAVYPAIRAGLVPPVKTIKAV